MSNDLRSIFLNLLLHKYFYYKDATLITDQEFDSLERIYEEFSDKKLPVGSPLKSWEDVRDKVMELLDYDMSSLKAQGLLRRHLKMFCKALHSSQD